MNTIDFTSYSERLLQSISKTMSLLFSVIDFEENNPENKVTLSYIRDISKTIKNNVKSLETVLQKKDSEIQKEKNDSNTNSSSFSKENNLMMKERSMIFEFFESGFFKNSIEKTATEGYYGWSENIPGKNFLVVKIKESLCKQDYEKALFFIILLILTKNNNNDF